MVDTASKTGFISQIIGPVIDIEFPNGELPKVYNALVIGSGDSIARAMVDIYIFPFCFDLLCAQFLRRAHLSIRLKF